MDRGPMSQNSSGRQGRETGVCPTVPSSADSFRILAPEGLPASRMTTQAGIFDVFGSPAPRSATRPCGPPCVQREVLAHRLTWAFSARSTGRKVVNGGPTGLFLSACYDEH